MKTLILLFGIFLLPFASNAAKVSPLFAGALEFGGDKLVDVTYSDGSKSNIEAGRGIILAGGAVVNFTETTPHTFEVQGTFGIKWTSTKQATNGEVDFYRWPLELLSFYRNTENNFRLGGGVTYQLGNELKGSKDASAISTKLKNALGFVVQGDYFIGAASNMALGLRYTTIQYETENFGGSASGNSFGLSFTYFWL